MPRKHPTPEVKENIQHFLAGILNYNARESGLSSPKVATKWDNNRMIVRGSLAHLIEFLPNDDPSVTESQRKSHLKYLLVQILQRRLKILFDERPKNELSKYQGIHEWKFALKLWYPPTQANYVALNLRALERHWNRTYNIASTAPLAKHNLPQRRYTKFVGRQAELECLLNLLAKNRQQIISIEGMAGIGKTTLALEAAYRCLRDYDFESIIFTSAQSQQFIGSHLARRFVAERNLEDLLQVIFRTLEYADNSPSTIEEQMTCLQEALEGKSALIILDNIETLTDQTDTIAFLGSLPAKVQVIVTSRARLGLEGRAIYLEPLNAKQCQELIKIQIQNQNLEIPVSARKPLNRIADGNPLAITYLVSSLSTGKETILKEPLAGTDLALYCFEQAAAQLRSAAEPTAYQLLLALSLFPDGASIEAIASLTEGCFAPERIAPGLDELYRRTLTFCSAPQRYYLHSLTQEYARLELARDSKFDISLRDRWLNWYLDFTAPYGAVYWHEWQDYRPLRDEWKNLRVAVDSCLQQQQYESVFHFWHCLKGFTLLNGHWLEREQWLQWLEAAAQERQDLGAIAELKFHRSYTLAFIDESDRDGKAMNLALEAWSMHRYLDVEMRFDLAMYVAALYIRQSPQNGNRAANLETATTWLARGAEILQIDLPSNAPRYRFQMHYYQAEIQCVRGDLDEALENYLLAHQIAEDSGLKRFFYFSSVRAALILNRQGRQIEAEDRLIKALHFTKEYEDRRGMAFCQKNLAELKQAQGDEIAAIELAEEAKKGFRKLRMRREMQMMESLLQQLKR